MERAYQPSPSVYFELIALVKKKKPVALATIIEAEGSTPQVAGASALFSEGGLVCGTIGGGFVEREAERLARSAFRDRRARVCSFDLAEEPSEEADGICGGRLTVLLDPHPEREIPVFEKMKKAAERRFSGTLVTLIKKGRDQRPKSIFRFWIQKNCRSEDLARPPLSGFKNAIRRVFEEGRPVLIKRKSVWLYLEPHAPPPRLVIAGAGHVGRAVAHFGRLLHFEVVVIDDRSEFANQQRFPEADRIVVADVGQTLRKFPVAPETHIVIVTRGHRHDEEALRACIKSRAGYIGLIGSERKVRLMREKFIKQGWSTAEEWDRIRAPIGLPIGSKTVEEIAVSIAAELVLVKRRNQKKSRKPVIFVG